MNTQIKTLPLVQLVAANNNVRKIGKDNGISELAASIKSIGLLQNLTVIPSENIDMFEVIAGGRRLSALKMLVEQGHLQDTYQVPVNIVEQDALEISLAENVLREHMHPADEFNAFDALNKHEGLSVEDIADRFGISTTKVRQRLKLANVAPQIFEAFKENQLSLEQVMGYAVTDNHDAQIEVFESPSTKYLNKSGIQNLLMNEAVKGSHKYAKFIGVDAYIAAGGTITKDLFSDAENVYFDDSGLLNRLVMDELIKQCQELMQREGWSWAEPIEDTYSAYDYRRIEQKQSAYSEQETQEIEGLVLELENCEAEHNEHSNLDEDVTELEEKISKIRARIEEIENSKFYYEPADLQIAGCFLTINSQAEMVIIRGIIKNAEHDNEANSNEGDAETCSSGTRANENLSAPIIEELTAIKTAAMRNELCQNHNAAFIALLMPLLKGIFYTKAYYSAGTPVEVKGETKDLERLIANPQNCKALNAWNAIIERWTETLPQSFNDLWNWLNEQSEQTIFDLLALCSAANFNGVIMRHENKGNRIEAADEIAEKIGNDMRNWWEISPEFLNRLKKTQIASIMREHQIEEKKITDAISFKKGDMITVAMRNMKNSNWLPDILRTAQKTELQISE